MDRLVASVAGMSATVYFISGAVAWFRVVYPSRTDARGSGVILDRAVAWTGLFVLFTLIALVKLRMAEWSDEALDVVLLLALLAVYAAGLVSVRVITSNMYGNKVVVLFAAASVAVGLMILLM